MSSKTNAGLAALACAQLMVTLDSTIMVIALPAAQQDVGLGDASKQWVLTAYALTLGGALGAALLNTVAVAYTAAHLREGPRTAAVYGYTAASALAAAVVIAGAVCVVLLRPRRPSMRADLVR